MRLTVRNKLFLGFGAVLLLLVVAVAVSLTKMSGMNAKAVAIGQSDLPSVRIVGDVNAAESDTRAAQLRSTAVSDAASIADAIKIRDEHAAQVDNGFKSYEKYVADSTDRALLTDAKGAWGAYVTGTQKVATLARAGRRTEAVKAIVAAKPQFDAASAKVVKWTDYNQKLAAKDVAAAASSYSSARTLLLIVASIALIIGACVAFFLARGITSGVAVVLERLKMLQDHCSTDLKNGLEAMADGDLTIKVTPVTPLIDNPGRDEIGQVAEAVNGIRNHTVGSVEAYNAMADKLAGVIGNVTGSASSVSSASQQMASTSEEAGKAVGEIANAVGDVAQGAERQVRQIDSVRTSADEAAEAARTSAEQAQEAAEVAAQAREVAREGVGSAEQATEAMRSVRDSSASVTEAIRELAGKSEAIGAIVETITGIAGQTNLLALNAAIEAARAGEQGRGFAVVAEEVRKLAEESQQAAEEIAGLVTQIQGETQKVVGVVEDGAHRTEQGAETVEHTREAFVRIGDAVEDVNARISQMAGAAQQISAETAKMQGEISEVAAVAEQSSASTEQVSASTEQTSASTQEIAASAQELAATAGELEQLVAQFKVAA